MALRKKQFVAIPNYVNQEEIVITAEVMVSSLSALSAFVLLHSGP